MNESNKEIVEGGDAVMRAVGELSSTAKDAAKSAAESNIDHEEVQGWLTTIIKAIVAALKP